MKYNRIKKWLHSLIGVLIILLSAVLVPIFVVSNFSKNSVEYNKNYTFSDLKSIQDSFKKANIPDIITNQYINSIEKSNNNNYSLKNNNLLSNITDVQNEISIRRIKNGLSLYELNKNISYVKNILQNDLDTFLHYSDNKHDNYEYVRALYVKNSISSWINLNNVKKYDLIYEYLDVIYDNIENFYELYYLKELINKKEIENRDREIEKNNNEIAKIRLEIQSQGDIINEKQNQIDQLRNSYIKNNKFKKVEEHWKLVTDLYISATTFASAAVVFLALSFIPIIGSAAFASGTISAGLASALGINLNLEINNMNKIIDANASEILSFISSMISFWAASNKIILNIETAINKIGQFFIGKLLRWGTSLVEAAAIVTIITAAVQIALMTHSYLNLRDEKNSYIDSLQSDVNNEINSSIDELIDEIKKINKTSYEKNMSIELLNRQNKLLNTEKTLIIDEVNNLNNESTIYYNSLVSIPFLSSSKINLLVDNASKNINNLEKNDLQSIYSEYDRRKIISINIKDKRLEKIKKFNSEYNYDDKEYWNYLIENSLEVSFDRMYLNFIN